MRHAPVPAGKDLNWRAHARARAQSPACGQARWRGGGSSGRGRAWGGGAQMGGERRRAGERGAGAATCGAQGGAARAPREGRRCA